MNLVETIVGDKISTSGSISSNFKNMFEAGHLKNDELVDEDSEIEEITESTTESNAELFALYGIDNKRNSRVVIPVRNGNATVVVPTDKEEKHNLINKINALLPRTADKVAIEKLNSHTIEELEVFYKQLQGKADALSEEGEFDLD